MAKETRYEVVTGNVVKAFSNNEGSSFKIELTSEKPMDFIKFAYSDVKNDRFLPEIMTKDDCNELSFHSKFTIPACIVNNNGVRLEIDSSTIGEGSSISVKLKSNGNGMYPVAIIVKNLIEKEPYDPFDFE